MAASHQEMIPKNSNNSTAMIQRSFWTCLYNKYIQMQGDSSFLRPLEIIENITERFLMSKDDRDDIKKYRLGPYALNVLVGKMVEANFKGQFEKGDGWYTIKSTKHNKTFVVFDMCKDAETAYNEKHLYFFYDALQKYCSQNTIGKQEIILIPLGLVRGFCYAPVQFEKLSFLKRKHATLLEINLAEQKIILHDSQSKSRSFLYPDKIKKIIDKISDLLGVTLSEEMRGYGKQTDSYSCEYFVMRYIDYILTTGSSNGCEDLLVEIKKNYADKTAYFESEGEKWDDRIKQLCAPDYDDLVDEFEMIIDLQEEAKKQMQSLTTEWVNWDANNDTETLVSLETNLTELNQASGKNPKTLDQVSEKKSFNCKQ